MSMKSVVILWYIRHIFSCKLSSLVVYFKVQTSIPPSSTMVCMVGSISMLPLTQSFLMTLDAMTLDAARVKPTVPCHSSGHCPWFSNVFWYYKTALQFMLCVNTHTLELRRHSPIKLVGESLPAGAGFIPARGGRSG